MYISINCLGNTMIIMSVPTNSPIWGENVYKRDRFLGKFKKGPPHIGEYEKKVHFQGGQSPMVTTHESHQLI